MHIMRRLMYMVEETEKQTEAFRKGYDARIANPDVVPPNPYAKGTPDHADYWAGWQLADQDYEAIADMVRPEPKTRTTH